MLFLSACYYDGLCIDLNHLVENMMINDSFFNFNLMNNIECCLDVSKLGTSLQHCYISVLVRLNVLRVHHVPELDCLVSVRNMRCTGHHN